MFDSTLCIKIVFYTKLGKKYYLSDILVRSYYEPEVTHAGQSVKQSGLSSKGIHYGSSFGNSLIVFKSK